MVHFLLSIEARSQKRSELLSACRMVAAETQREKGCLGCRISQDIDDENRIYLEETWSARPLLDAYFRSDVFSALFGAVKLLSVIKEFRINTWIESEGLEAIQAVQSNRRISAQ